MGDLMQKGAILFLGLLLGAGVLLYFIYLPPDPGMTNQQETSSGLMKTETEFRDKLTELKMRRDKVHRGIKKLTELKKDAVELLRSKGINSGQDFLKSEDKDVKFAVKNLKEYKIQIEKVEKEVEFYDEAIDGIRVMLDRFERERIGDSISLSEKDSLELQKIIVDLNERLEVDTDILEDEELSKLLDDEFGN